MRSRCSQALQKSSRAIGEAFTTEWPRTARFAGMMMGIVELLLLALPPHRPPDSGLLVFAGGLILVPNGAEYQRRRQRERDREEEAEEEREHK